MLGQCRGSDSRLFDLMIQTVGQFHSFTAVKMRSLSISIIAPKRRNTTLVSQWQIRLIGRLATYSSSALSTKTQVTRVKRCKSGLKSWRSWIRAKKFPNLPVKISDIFSIFPPKILRNFVVKLFSFSTYFLFEIGSSGYNNVSRSPATPTTLLSKIWGSRPPTNRTDAPANRHFR